MKRFILGIVLFLSLFNSTFAGEHKDIFIVNYGWHAGIIIKVKDINSSVWNVDPFFKKFEYLEVGWGDEDFYKSLDPSAWLALKAVLVPTASVLHINAASKLYLNSFSKENIVKITISKNGFNKLSMFIEKSFFKKDGKIVKLGKGLYPGSFFYLSREKYHIFNTCNVWTAKALKSAELDIYPSSAITTKDLFSQIRDIENQ